MPPMLGSSQVLLNRDHHAAYFEASFDRGILGSPPMISVLRCLSGSKPVCHLELYSRVAHVVGLEIERPMASKEVALDFD